MKIKILLILSFFWITSIFSQEFEEMCNSIQKFNTASEFDAIDCDIYIALGTIMHNSYSENKSDESYAMESFTKWLEGTSTYHLIIGGKILEDCDKDDETLKIIFKACMVEFMFANHQYIHPTKNGIRYINIYEVREVISGGAEIFMDYLSRQRKSVINKEHRKGLKLYHEGKLKEYMDS